MAWYLVKQRGNVPLPLRNFATARQCEEAQVFFIKAVKILAWQNLIQKLTN
jgi:hypothetical protein